MATIQDKAKALISSKMKVDESEVTEDKHLFNDLGADSLDFVELSMTLEREFNVKFKEEDMASVKTVGDVYALIEKYTMNK
jgi:acyl carrier protein